MSPNTKCTSVIKNDHSSESCLKSSHCDNQKQIKSSNNSGNLCAISNKRSIQQTDSQLVQTVPTPHNATQTNETLNGTSSLSMKLGQEKPKENPTYSELGIITEKPKRQDLALKQKRLESFHNWPEDHHLKREDLVDAGFYYAGYGDCARCFYCSGGLRNWEIGDDVWVEHARWFPKCAYIRQQMGQIFIQAVQDLNKTHDKIPFSIVKEKIAAPFWSLHYETKSNPLKRDPAVKTLIECQFLEKDVLEVAEKVKKDNPLSSDLLLEKLKLFRKSRDSNATQEHQSSDSHNSKQIQEQIRDLKEKNVQLREQMLCKICMDSQVEIVFLPCGHLVSCKDCALALKDCPIRLSWAGFYSSKITKLKSNMRNIAHSGLNTRYSSWGLQIKLLQLLLEIRKLPCVHSYSLNLQPHRVEENDYS
nr:baculoviral IAP repeat-containing protein 3-like isoform X1 [Biomphalaria glabrata]